MKNQIKNQIENWMEYQILIENQTTEQTENFISKLILPDHIVFHPKNQISEFWHKVSSIRSNLTQEISIMNSHNVHGVIDDLYQKNARFSKKIKYNNYHSVMWLTHVLT